jgi:hypothetical protein
VQHCHDQLLDVGVDAGPAIRALVLVLLERGIYEADRAAVDHSDEDGPIGLVDSVAVPALQRIGVRDVAEGRLPSNDLLGDLEVQPDDRRHVFTPRTPHRRLHGLGLYRAAFLLYETSRRTSDHRVGGGAMGEAGLGTVQRGRFQFRPGWPDA